MNQSLIAALYEEHRPALMRYAFRILGNQFDAEDAVQEVFLVLLEKPEALAKVLDKKAWMYGILKHVIQSMLRKRSRELAIIQNYTILQKSSRSLELSPIVLLGSGLRQRTELEMLILFYCYGYRIEDLCRHYHIGVSACKMRIHRYRHALRQQYQLVS